MQRALCMHKNGYNLTKLRTKLSTRFKKEFYYTYLRRNVEQNSLRINLRDDDETRYNLEVCDLGEYFILQTNNEQDTAYLHSQGVYDIVFSMIEKTIKAGTK